MTVIEPFERRHVRALGRSVFRLGLAVNYGIDEQAFDRGIERGMDYVFWTRLRTGKVTGALKRAVARDRERIIVATGPSVGWFGGSVRRSAESALRELGTDYIDVFHLFWVGVGAAWSDATVEALVKLREEGKIRAIGISTHDRKRAAELAKSSPIDLYMLRYNAAHPGAEKDIWPFLPEKKPAVVAYTATSWRKLMKKPSGWSGPVMSAGDCYRFCLSSPPVDVVLTGPKSAAELDENLAAMAKGPLDPDEARWMREFGHAVHG
jgi:aryl-alcohol dehydrogenase-like predicted oxidoreductase